MARLALQGATAFLAKTNGEQPSLVQIVAEAEKRMQRGCILDTLMDVEDHNCLELSLLLRMEDPVMLRTAR